MISVLYSVEQGYFHIEELDDTWKLNVSQLIKYGKIENTYRLVGLVDNYKEANRLINQIEDAMKNTKGDK